MKHLTALKKSVALFSSVAMIATSFCIPGLSTIVMADSLEDQTTDTVSAPAAQSPVTSLSAVTNLKWVSGSNAKLTWDASDGANQYLVKVKVYSADGKTQIGTGELETSNTTVDLQVSDLTRINQRNAKISATVYAQYTEFGEVLVQSSGVTSSKRAYDGSDLYVPTPTNVTLTKQGDNILLSFNFDMENPDDIIDEFILKISVNGEIDYNFWIYNSGQYGQEATWNNGVCTIDVTEHIESAFDYYAENHYCGSDVDIECQVQLSPRYQSPYSASDYSEPSNSIRFYKDYQQLSTPANATLAYDNDGRLILTFNYDPSDPIQSIRYVNIKFLLDGTDKYASWGISTAADCFDGEPLWNNGTCTMNVTYYAERAISSFISNHYCNGEGDFACAIELRSNNNILFDSLESSPSNKIHFAKEYEYTKLTAPTNVQLSKNSDGRIILTFDTDVNDPETEIEYTLVNLYFNGVYCDNLYFGQYYDSQIVWNNGSCSIELTDSINFIYSENDYSGEVEVTCQVKFVSENRDTIHDSDYSEFSNSVKYKELLNLSISDSSVTNRVTNVYWNNYNKASLSWISARNANYYAVTVNVYNPNTMELIGSQETGTSSNYIYLTNTIQDIIEVSGYDTVKVSATVYSQQKDNGVVISQSDGVTSKLRLYSTDELTLSKPANLTIDSNNILSFTCDQSISDVEISQYNLFISDEGNSDLGYSGSEQNYSLKPNSVDYNNGRYYIDLNQMILDQCRAGYHTGNVEIKCRVQLKTNDPRYESESELSDYSNTVFFNSTATTLPEPSNVNLTKDLVLKFSCNVDNPKETIDQIKYEIELYSSDTQEWYSGTVFETTASSENWKDGVCRINIKDKVEEQYRGLENITSNETVSVRCSVEFTSNDERYFLHSRYVESNFVNYTGNLLVLPALTNVSLDNKLLLSFDSSLENADDLIDGIFYDIKIFDTDMNCIYTYSSSAESYRLRWNNGTCHVHKYAYIDSAVQNACYYSETTEDYVYVSICVTPYTNSDGYAYNGTQSEWSEPILYCRDSSKIESLTIYPSELTLEKGSSYEIDYSYTPNVAFLEKPWFSIDNNDVLYLYNTNEIHAESVGTAHVTATIGSFSQTITVTVVDAIYGNIEIIKQPEDFTGSSGEVATFEVTATGDNLTYEWQYNDDDYWRSSKSLGNNSPKLSVLISDIRDGRQYRCIVSSEDGYVYSEPATIHVSSAALKINTQPSDYSGLVGETAQFNVIASGQGLTYQWQFNNGSGWKKSSAAGSNTSTLSVKVTEARNGQQYRCIITQGDKSVTSDPATLTVLKPVVIASDPIDFTGPIGTYAKFTVEAEGENLTYQWQYKNAKGVWNNSNATGYNTATMKVKVTEARDGQKYRCIVTSGETSVTSGEAAIHVEKPTVKITSDPSDVTGPIGTYAKFTVVAEGENLTYQWQYMNSKGVWNNSNATGYNTATMKVKITEARDGQKYRCIVTSGETSVTSGEAAIHVDKPTVKITSDPSDVTGPVGTYAVFTVEAEGDEVTYQWQYKPANGSWKNSNSTGYNTASMKIKISD
ncbi:MAG: hypothetical protein IKM72_02175, partial [Oscillospiraceae bacterium]|nr:hypothetical protein [Oscillospiraceae bacterium]